MAQAAPYTVLQLLTRSLRLLGLLNSGDPPTPDEVQNSLEALNSLVGSWATRRLMVYARARLVFPLSPGQPSYEIGPQAADFVCQRPIYIDGAGILWAGGSELFEQPVHVCTPDEWRLNRSKTLSTGGSIINEIYYDHGYSNANVTGAADAGSGKIFVWPIPAAASSLALYLPQAVSEFTSTSQTLSLPPGYRRALAYNLAIEEAPEFTVEPSDLVVAIAQSSLENVMRSPGIARTGPKAMPAWNPTPDIT